MNYKHEDTIRKISKDYLDNLKPLLEILKVRTDDQYPQNCLNEIRAINDHIARCHRNGIVDDDITKELGKAEGHLQRLAYDCYKQLIIYQVADIKHTINRFYSSMWVSIGNGKLWSVYINNYKKAKEQEKEAKINESIDPDMALYYYDNAYNKYQIILNTFNKYKCNIISSCFVKFCESILNGSLWFLTSFATAFVIEIITMLCKYYIS